MKLCIFCGQWVQIENYGGAFHVRLPTLRFGVIICSGPVCVFERHVEAIFREKFAVVTAAHGYTPEFFEALQQ